jgi:hypothetical protein
VLPGLKLGVGDARDEIENMQQCRSWINQHHLQLKKLCASMCNSEIIWAKCYHWQELVVSGCMMIKKLALLGLLMAKIRNRRKFQELLLQSQICAHNFVQIKRSPRVVRDGGGLEARGQRALFHFERLGPLTSSRF